jgi:hypothetical protein
MERLVAAPSLLFFHHICLDDWRQLQSLVSAALEANDVAFAKLAGEDLERQRVFQLALDGALERVGAESGDSFVIPVNVVSLPRQYPVILSMGGSTYRLIIMNVLL